MDYSLLVGIHDFEREDEESDGDDGLDSQDESDLESPNDYDASGTNESAGDSPTSSPPGTPPATPPSTPPPTGLTPASRPPLKSRTVSQDSNELLDAEQLGSEFFAVPCKEGMPNVSSLSFDNSLIVFIIIHLAGLVLSSKSIEAVYKLVFSWYDLQYSYLIAVFTYLNTGLHSGY